MLSCPKKESIFTNIDNISFHYNHLSFSILHELSPHKPTFMNEITTYNCSIPQNNNPTDKLFLKIKACMRNINDQSWSKLFEALLLFCGTWYAKSHYNMVNFLQNTHNRHPIACPAMGCLNPLCAKFFRGNLNIYLHFVSFLHIDTMQVVEILPQIRQEPTYST